MIRIVWPKWSKIINQKFIPLTRCRDRYVILYGSRGSSKSDYIAKQLVYNCLTHKYFKCILYRRKYNTIQESSYENIKQTILTLGLQDVFTFKVAPLQIICANGNRFIARGGDDSASLKSIKDPTCVWYEEDIPAEEDFATISLTIRSGKADCLQEYFSINPEVEGDYTENWFWKRYFEGRNELSYRTTLEVEVETRKVVYNVTVHHSVYQDNRWLPDAVKAQIEAYKTTNPYLYSIYAKGLWTRKQTGGNFYKLFDRSRNTGLVTYRPDLPLHISFDFNVNPYMTCTVWQLEGKQARQIDEITLASPLNRTEAVCREFERRYPSHTAGLFVYGDPSGMQEDTRTEKGYNDFVVIQRSMAKYKPSLRVAKAAPPVVMRGNWINSVFAHNTGGMEILIGDKCGKSISDLMYLKEASDGTKAKTKEKDPETGISYERYGHCFIGDTLITTLEGQKPIKDIKPGDMVLTRYGFYKVKTLFDNGIRFVNTFKIGDKTIRCTPDHHFWTEEHEFVPIGHLTKSNTFCIFETNKVLKCKLPVLNLTVSNLNDTPKQKEDQIEFITVDGLRKTTYEKKNACTDTFGGLQMAKYLLGIISTTLTATPLITALKTFLWNVGKIICHTTQKTPQKILRLPEHIHLTQKQGNGPKNGTSRQKEGNGIGIILSKLLNKAASIKSVLNAESITPGIQILGNQNIVQKNANQGTECGKIENQANGMSDVFVQSAGERLQLTNGIKQNAAQKNAGLNYERVYDLEIEDVHEYFANGILVHNCSDSMDYLLCYAYQAEFVAYQKGGVPTKISVGKNAPKRPY